MEWQYSLIKELFRNYGERVRALSSIPIDISAPYKTKYLPDSLYKYYAPTIENISDLANQLLWLASPSSFNDPKDCQMTIANNFEPYVLDKLIIGSSDFSSTEKSLISRDSRCMSSNTSYCPKYNVILHKKDKAIYEPLYDEIRKLQWEAEKYIRSLKSNAYRIACFSQPYSYDNLDYHQLMWSHYTQSYKGFRVEYDIKQILNYDFKDYSYSNHTKDRFNCGLLYGPRLKRILINGLFPVVYKSKQVSIPAATAYRIALDNCCKRYLQNTEILFLKSLITKDLIWKYEQEWRLIVDEEIVKSIGYKIPFPFAKSIQIGSAASAEVVLLLKSIAKTLGIPCHGPFVEATYGLNYSEKSSIPSEYL